MERERVAFYPSLTKKEIKYSFSHADGKGITKCSFNTWHLNM